MRSPVNHKLLLVFPILTRTLGAGVESTAITLQDVRTRTARIDNRGD